MKASLTLADVQSFMWDADVAQPDQAKDLCAWTCKGLFTSREGQPTLMEAAFSTNQALSCRCCDAYCVLVILLLVLMLNVLAASLSFKLRCHHSHDYHVYVAATDRMWTAGPPPDCTPHSDHSA